MAFQFSTGFDFYTVPVQSGLWDTSSGTITISSASARFGGTHSQGANFAQNSVVQKNLVGNQATVIVQWAIQTPANPASTAAILYVLDASSVQVSLGITSGGALQFYRGAPSTNAIGSASSTNFTSGVWHYVEALVTVHPTAGVVQCWLDGVQVINSSTLNTRATSNSFANQFRIGECNNVLASLKCDDVLCFDGSGGVLDNRIGDKRIGCLMAASDGTYTDFLPVGAATGHECIDEIPANDNTDYISSATVNARSSFNYETISISGNADFIVPWARIMKDDAAAHTVELSLTDTGNDSFSSAIAVPSSYGYVNGGAFLTSPNGAAAWSQTVINRTQPGIKIIS